MTGVEVAALLSTALSLVGRVVTVAERLVDGKDATPEEVDVAFKAADEAEKTLKDKIKPSEP